MKDGKADWSAEALATNANVFLDDFLLFDLDKPMNDQSHREIEKSTIDGRPYRTGGGRTVDANVFDILLTWLVEGPGGDEAGGLPPLCGAHDYAESAFSRLETVLVFNSLML
jgi:hypothetical protein